MKSILKHILSALFCCLVIVSLDGCATIREKIHYSMMNKRQKKIYNMKKDTTTINLSLPEEKEFDLVVPENVGMPESDTLKVKGLNGEDVFVMKAIKDDATGEMVATEQLKAAIVTARFRNVAERHGEIDIQFQITVPHEMLDTKWQLRFYPDLTLLGKTTDLDQVIITGQDYRKAQLKGYQHYNKFVASIISDTTKFIDLHNLEVWISRNLPEVYRYKTDSTEVADETFKSILGVTEQEAVEHYTNQFAKKMNERRKAKMGKMYRKYVKAPIITDNVRLDTVLTNFEGDFEYVYDYTIKTQPKLRKADVTVRGEIFEQDMLLYDIPRGKPVTFYISSLSSFVDKTPRYLTKIIMRQAEANQTYNLDFSVGKSDIDMTLGTNAEEINRIKSNLRDLVHNKTFDLDSILITASASPEGSMKANYSLSLSRAASASKYFSNFLQSYKDSVRRAEGVFLTLGDPTEVVAQREQLQDVKFSSASIGEDWNSLDLLVEYDDTLTIEQKNSYNALKSLIDLDEREVKMKGASYYKYVSSRLYPKLRAVKFNFYLHRKGMIQDSVQTTELDTTYMAGIQAIDDRDYAKAVSLLRPYHCYNTAVAYCAWDRNESAREILVGLPRTAQVLYMLAIIHSRTGDDRSAVECYMQSCELEPSYKHRGNLDPEIAALIKRYGLNKEDDIQTDF